MREEDYQKAKEIKQQMAMGFEIRERLSRADCESCVFKFKGDAEDLILIDPYHVVKMTDEYYAGKLGMWKEEFEKL